MRRNIAIVLALVALAACNTMKGAGQDVEDAGSAITGQAQQTQSQM